MEKERQGLPQGLQQPVAKPTERSSNAEVSNDFISTNPLDVKESPVVED